MSKFEALVKCLRAFDVLLLRQNARDPRDRCKGGILLADSCLWFARTMGTSFDLKVLDWHGKIRSSKNTYRRRCH